jgi:hypothetical protein
MGFLSQLLAFTFCVSILSKQSAAIYVMWTDKPAIEPRRPWPGTWQPPITAFKLATVLLDFISPLVPILWIVKAACLNNHTDIGSFSRLL